MIKVYGIKSCDRCRKATGWLKKSGIDHQFHDLRKDGLEDRQIKHWLKRLSHDALLNKRSTTWRQLSEAEKTKALDKTRFSDIVLEHPTLLKRPIFDTGDEVFVGFSAAVTTELEKLGAD